MVKLRLVGRKYTFETLKALDNKPRRYGELLGIVNSPKTLTRRLKELRNAGFVTVSPAVKNSRPFFNYTISPRGCSLLKELQKLKKI